MFKLFLNKIIFLLFFLNTIFSCEIERPYIYYIMEYEAVLSSCNEHHGNVNNYFEKNTSLYKGLCKLIKEISELDKEINTLQIRKSSETILPKERDYLKQFLVGRLLERNRLRIKGDRIIRWWKPFQTEKLRDH